LSDGHSHRSTKVSRRCRSDCTCFLCAARFFCIFVIHLSHPLRLLRTASSHWLLSPYSLSLDLSSLDPRQKFPGHQNYCPECCPSKISAHLSNSDSITTSLTQEFKFPYSLVAISTDCYQRWNLSYTTAPILILSTTRGRTIVEKE
jgi:hypothetical protein